MEPCDSQLCPRLGEPFAVLVGSEGEDLVQARVQAVCSVTQQFAQILASRTVEGDRVVEDSHLVCPAIFLVPNDH